MKITQNSNDCVFEGSFWISIMGDHYAVWERELERDEILSGSIEPWVGDSRLRCCFRLADATLILHQNDDSEILLVDKGVVKVQGIGIRPLRRNVAERDSKRSIVQTIEYYPNDAWAGCDDENFFDSRRLYLLTEELIFKGESIEVVSRLEYNGKELMLENYDEQLDRSDLERIVLYDSKRFEVADVERLPLSFVNQWREDNRSSY